MTSSKLSGSAENFYFLNTSSPRTPPFLWEKKNEIEILRKMTDDGLGLELKNELDILSKSKHNSKFCDLS